MSKDMNEEILEVPAELTKPKDVFEFFLKHYSEYSEDDLLDLMRDSVSEEQFAELAKLDHMDLVEIYCHGMVAGYFVCGVSHSHLGEHDHD